jgi:4-alpha-glucanotransferase
MSKKNKADSTTKKKTAPVEMNASANPRGAGILLHITSLPSPFGVGDLGPQAKAFAAFLHRSKQKYWQLLPLNPVESKQAYSPYSALSSMAGNTLVISPEALAMEGLLTENDLASVRLPSKSKTDLIKAEQLKNKLFDKAYQRFVKKSSGRQREYAIFTQTQASWLNDFALYSVLKTIHKTPWYEWPDQYRLRDKKALEDIKSAHAEDLDKVKWLQFVFFEQWKNLKTYCNELNIRLFGDLPFYVNYDSADVWANKEIFCLDEDGKMTGMAGVPPDYFNSDGQLWGMPVFKWSELKYQHYEWWIQRLTKNLELYDLLRLDHFRAFADFWEVPANEKTAINGKWQPGPGADFFESVKQRLGKLPFVAEDLGDINEGVHQLRKQFNFPGMKILQFSFGDNMPQSDYIPHNYADTNFIVYTGTHDNNTTAGWFRKDIGKKEKNNLTAYLDKKVSEKTVHRELTKLAYCSVARIAILPMQDVLGLDESARMNIPASTSGNWTWRLKQSQLNTKIEKELAALVGFYNRG